MRPRTLKSCTCAFALLLSLQSMQLHAQSADALSVQEANQIAWDGPLTIYVPRV